MQTNDYCAIPTFLKDQVGARYPGARRALLKSGGDFPFLSRADEVNLHAQVLFTALLVQEHRLRHLLKEHEVFLYFLF